MPPTKTTFHVQISIQKVDIHHFSPYFSSLWKPRPTSGLFVSLSSTSNILIYPLYNLNKIQWYLFNALILLKILVELKFYNLVVVYYFFVDRVQVNLVYNTMYTIQQQNISQHSHIQIYSTNIQEFHA